MPTTDERAHELLRELAGPNATFRDGQLDAITQVTEHHARALVVQRTGWGKSAVYFIATKILREAGKGPTILISPLLALMRNQIAMAERLGVKARTINSANKDDWESVIDDIEADNVDLLLVSPERFANMDFRDEVLPTLAKQTGLLVIDEVHCISDWGHDFRPDYRRVNAILDLLPEGTPVLGTTATANDRVVKDVVEQLGGNLTPIRGTLAREGLALQVIRLPAPATRLAWLTTTIPTLDGSGIVYALTIRDADMVSTWLQQHGISAVAYSGETDNDLREQIEDDLLANRVKVVVATSALGMGYDKPDLAFVIHYQSPGSPIAYYQQVGRAGRALDTSFGVLLSGNEDRNIQDYFIQTAFPPQHLAEKVIDHLAAATKPQSIAVLEAEVNIRRGRLTQMLKVLEVEGVVERQRGGYVRTALEWTYPTERIDGVTNARRAEQAVMEDYMTTDDCLMMFLRRELDDPGIEKCGICANCTGAGLPTDVDNALAVEATTFLRHRPIAIEPRRQWPSGVEGRSGRVGDDVRLEAGRSLSALNDGGWGDTVHAGRFTEGFYNDDLVEAAARAIEEWGVKVSWLTFVPSRDKAGSVGDFAVRLGARLALPVREAVARAGTNRPQAEMENSAQQFTNVHGAFEVAEADAEPVLLIDDIHDSKWTLTVVGAALREAGSGPVYPFTLASTMG